MPKLFAYSCSECKKTSHINDGDPIPFCCGKMMQRIDLDHCTDPKDAETHRMEKEDGPCDDNRKN